jgi:SSS family solute:Na+ symporter/sodium/proline symporter
MPCTARHGLSAFVGAVMLGAIFAKVISTASNDQFSPVSHLIEDGFVRYRAPRASNKQVPIFPRPAVVLPGALSGHICAEHLAKNALRLHHLTR